VTLMTALLCGLNSRKVPGNPGGLTFSIFSESRNRIPPCSSPTTTSVIAACKRQFEDSTYRGTKAQDLLLKFVVQNGTVPAGCAPKTCSQAWMSLGRL